MNYFKKILLSLFASLVFLLFPQHAFADTAFTVSNMNFNSTTGAFSFDYDADGVVLNHQVTLRLPYDAAVFNYDANVGDFSCTSSHCSGTYTGDKSNFTCSGTDYRVMSTTNVNGNEIQYTSNALAASDFSNECSTPPPPPVINVTSFEYLPCSPDCRTLVIHYDNFPAPDMGLINVDASGNFISGAYGSTSFTDTEVVFNIPNNNQPWDQYMQLASSNGGLSAILNLLDTPTHYPVSGWPGTAVHITDTSLNIGTGIATITLDQTAPHNTCSVIAYPDAYTYSTDSCTASGTTVTAHFANPPPDLTYPHEFWILFEEGPTRYGYTDTTFTVDFGTPTPTPTPTGPTAIVDLMNPDGVFLTLPGYSLDCWNDTSFTATIYNVSDNSVVASLSNASGGKCGFRYVNDMSKIWTSFVPAVLHAGTYRVTAQSGGTTWASEDFTYVPLEFSDLTFDANTNIVTFSPPTDLYPSVGDTEYFNLALTFRDDNGVVLGAYNHGEYSFNQVSCIRGGSCSGTVNPNDGYGTRDGASHASLALCQPNSNCFFSDVESLAVEPTPTPTPTPVPNQPPAVSFNVNSSGINEGDEFTATGSFTDPDSTSWTATVNYGDGSGVQTLELSGQTFSLSHVYVDNGTYTISVSVTDNGNLTGTSTGSGGGVVVNNPAPVIPPITPPTNVGQNSPAVVNVNFNDYGNQTHTATINWGDGGGNQSVPVSGSNFSSDHNYQNPGTYTVTVTVTDSQGATTTQTLTITVANVAPHVGTINFPSTVAVSNSVPLSVNFTDQGVVDTHTATINWGDGHTTNGTVTETNGSGSVNGNHTYTSAGTYTIIVTVTDDDNGSGSSTTGTTANNQVSVLSPVGIWIGLKNSDDVGIKFDLKVEAYKDSTLVASGQLNSFAGGSSGFNNAHLATIPFDSFTPVNFPSGSVLSLKVLVRNACVGSGKNSGHARLWYNDSAANSKFGTTIGGSSTNYFLRYVLFLSPTAGTQQKTIDVQSEAKCSPFKTFGTWTVTP